MRRLPTPRGPLTELLIAALQDAPGALEPVELPPLRNRWPTRTFSSPCTCATSCTTAVSRASTTAGNGIRRCSRCAASSSAGSSTRSWRPCRVPARECARRHRRDPARHLGGGGSVRCPPTSRSAPPPRRGPRVRRTPLGLPAQGGRSPFVGDPPAVRRPQGGADRDPDRRVRQRPTPTGSTPSCSRRAMRGPRPRLRPTAPTSISSPRSRWRPST